jgi:hypothetical protein
MEILPEFVGCLSHLFDRRRSYRGMRPPQARRRQPLLTGPIAVILPAKSQKRGSQAP